MKKTIRFLSLILAVILCLGLASSVGMASGEYGEDAPPQEIAEAPAEEPAEEIAEEPAEEPEEEPAEAPEQPAEDGFSYYFDDSAGEYVSAEPWAWAEKSWYEMSGGKAELRVMNDGSRADITYQWYRVEEDGPRMPMTGAPLLDGEPAAASPQGTRPESPVESQRTETPIAGATGAVYSAGEAGLYSCVVTGQMKPGVEDPAGVDSVTVEFYVMNEPGVEMPDSVQFYAKGNEPGNPSARVEAELGESLTLETEMSTQPNAVVSNVRYRWYQVVDSDGYSDLQEIPGAEGSRYTIGAVKGSGTYTAVAEYEYTYTDPDTKEAVSGRFAADADFYVHVESGLTIGLDAEELRKDPNVVAVREYRVEGRLVSCDILALPDKPLTVTAIAEANDEVSVSGTWSGPEDRQPQQGLVLKTDSKTGRELYFTAKDSLGNVEQFSLNVIVQNHFSAAPAGAEPGRHEVNISAAPGGVYKLKAEVTADDPAGVTYEWTRMGKSAWSGLTTRSYRETADGMSVSVSGPGDELTVSFPTESVTYRCLVDDGLGSRRYVYFHLNLNGDTYGTTGRMDPPDEDIDHDGRLTANDAAAYLSAAEPGSALSAVIALRKLTGLIPIG